MDHGGWYDRKTLNFRQTLNLQFLASLTPSNDQISPRMLRHFHVISFLAMSDSGVLELFTPIVQLFLSARFPPRIHSLAAVCTLASLTILRSAQILFRPTPEKSHYVFSVRDISSVLQGVLEADPSQV
jgi:dynein heavy chain